MLLFGEGRMYSADELHTRSGDAQPTAIVRTFTESRPVRPGSDGIGAVMMK